MLAVPLAVASTAVAGASAQSMRDLSHSENSQYRRVLEDLNGRRRLTKGRRRCALDLAQILRATIALTDSPLMLRWFQGECD